MKHPCGTTRTLDEGKVGKLLISEGTEGVARYETKRIDHQQAYSLDGACTNWAESYFSRLRRGEAGHHHHISGPYLLRFAHEAAWREDNRRVPNGQQVQRVAKLALGRKKSVDFTGYWQRHAVRGTP